MDRLSDRPPSAEAPSGRPAPGSAHGLVVSRLTRRLLLLGAGGAGVAAAGMIAARMKAPPESADDLALAQATASPPDAAPTQVPPAAASPAAVATPHAAAGPAVPRGMALVTSPRLPLIGIGADQAAALLRGDIVDWRALGSAVGG